MCAAKASMTGAQLPELQPKSLQAWASAGVTLTFSAPDMAITVASATDAIATSIFLSWVQVFIVPAAI